MSMKVISHRRHRDEVERLKEEREVLKVDILGYQSEHIRLTARLEARYPTLTLIETIRKWYEERKKTS